MQIKVVISAIFKADLSKVQIRRDCRLIFWVHFTLQSALNPAFNEPAKRAA
jgi:hypothetical protein